MESIASHLIKLLLRILRYNKPYKISEVDPKKIRKDDIAEPGRWMCRGCSVMYEKINSKKVWLITPKNYSDDRKLIYFHGGAFIGGMVKQQWNTIAKIGRLLNTQVIIPEYPLAPESYYKDAIDMISDSYKKIIETTSPETISFIGDSAGGGLMLSFAMLLRNKGLQLPSKIIALSPWVDATMTNPKALELEVLDPMIAVPGLKKAGELYANGTDPSHYLISPLYGEMKGLPPIHIFAGTHDILQPDEKLFAEKASKAGVKTYYYEYPSMIHGWMFLPIPEAKNTISKIVEICKN